MSEAEFSITVSPTDGGQRLDAFLASRIAETSRSMIQRAIDEGDITVNDCETKSSYKVRPGDLIQIEVSPAPPLEALPEPIPLNVIFEDDQLIVVDKPAGMVVHPGAGIRSGTLANALVYHFGLFGQLAPSGESYRPGIVHRLDIGTSGLIVVAKTDQALYHLSEQFAERRVKKLYRALVYGSVAANRGEIDKPIGRDPRIRVKMTVRPAGLGRTALTLYQAAERFDDFTLLDVEIKTGRTHQIRVHLAHLKHPVVGDSGYDSGRGKHYADARTRGAILALGRPFLHAARLEFAHPKSGDLMSFNSALPDELAEFLEMLRRKQH